jgi:hypothetical protein
MTSGYGQFILNWIYRRMAYMVDVYVTKTSLYKIYYIYIFYFYLAYTSILFAYLVTCDKWLWLIYFEWNI